MNHDCFFFQGMQFWEATDVIVSQTLFNLLYAALSCFIITLVILPHPLLCCVTMIVVASILGGVLVCLCVRAGARGGSPTDDRSSKSVGAGRHHGDGERVCPSGGPHLLLVLLLLCVCVCVCVCVSARLDGCIQYVYTYVSCLHWD